jgi:hypothetical protein
MVRIELLRYENPEGLHDIETAWRDLARKLLEHVEELDSVLASVPVKYQESPHNPTKFPVKFTPKI